MLKCPYCGSSHYIDYGGYTTTVCYSPVWKDGVNVNPDRNITTTTYKCLDCGKEFVTNNAFGAMGNQNTDEYIKNGSVAMGEGVKVKDPNSIIIKSNKLSINGDCFETTIDLASDKLEKFDKIIINGITFVRETK